MKAIAKTLLLALAFAGLGYWAWGKIAGTGDSSEPATAHATSTGSISVTSSPEAPVVVTYFSSDVRCATCLKIEALTRRAVEERFAGPLAKGQIAFQILNMDEEENAHFVDDYELAFKTVVIRGDAHAGDAHAGDAHAGDAHAGDAQKNATDEKSVEPWVKMDEVWSLTAKPDEFIDYLAAEIGRRLPEAG